eukprot:m.29566 g.29566  ORF g.29566 m.29566 type:complete len:337 (+) comp9181_c0_seq1:112-1122(+)
MDLWDLAKKERDAAQRSGTSSSAEDRTLVVAGAKSSGKSTLISRLIDSSSVKATVALEYTFARRNRSTGVGKDVAHIWELGGGTELATLIEMPITATSVKTLSVAIVVNLAEPETIWTTVDKLVLRARKRIDKVFGDLKAKGSKLPAYLEKKALSKYASDSPDLKMISPFPVPLVIFGAHYDQYQDFDSEKRKIITRALRFLAHYYGATLLYVSDKDDGLMNKARNLLASMAFKIPVNFRSAHFDHDKAVLIQAGVDTLVSIGTPPQAQTSGARTPLDMWKAAFTSVFPQTSTATKAAVSAVVEGEFQEPAVDDARDRKMDELERQRRRDRSRSHK